MKNNQNQSQSPINFMRYRYGYFIFSAIVIIPGIFILLRDGLRPAIDFTGGSLLEVYESPISSLSEDQIRQLAPASVTVASIQKTSNGTYVIRTNLIDKDLSLQYRLALTTASTPNQTATASGSALQPVEEVRFETVGPTLGQELLQKTVVAVALAASLIMLFVAYRFKSLKYGVSAILAMLHDSLVLLSIFALLGYFYNVEVDTLFVTGMLTVLSFSVHDTIVVYDRIRESTKKYHHVRYYDLINKAITETMARSINNSMTIIFMLLALWLFGGVTMKWFVLTLLVGTISGTYSSPFIAAPILLEWDRLAAKISKTKKKSKL